MTNFPDVVQLILGIVLIASSLGVILARKPVYAGLSFLLTLLTLSALYLQLSASFIAAMQILVYAGAILVMFMFVIILFQDAYLQIENYKSQSATRFLTVAASLFVMAFLYLAWSLYGSVITTVSLPNDYGTVQALGRLLYLDFFFPFEAIILLFLVAVIGALYIGKKEISY